MQPFFPIADLDHPPIAATNDAARFHPFDPAGLGWTAAATDEQRSAALPSFGLGVTYRVDPDLGAALALRLPCVGELSGEVTIVDNQITVRSIALQLPAAALQRLFFGGLDVAAARLRFSFDAALTGRLHAALQALYDAGTLQRQFADPLKDIIIVDGACTIVDLSGTSNEELRQQHVAGLLDAETVVVWKLTKADASTTLVDLLPGESVVLHAEVKGAADGAWWRCNAGFFLRALGLGEGLPVPARAKLYDLLADDHYGLVASSGQIPAQFGEIIVVSGGSRDSVVLQPLVGDRVPATLFTFSTAEDIRLFAPSLVGQSVAVICAQPTLDNAGMIRVRDQLPPKKADNADRVFVPPIGEPILASAYGKHVPSGKLPAATSKFYEAVDREHGYDPLFERRDTLGPVATTERIVNLNQHEGLRPAHLPWKMRAAQFRRLYPLRLRLSWQQRQVDLEQDEADCARQEYVFHMQWTTGADGAMYYQSTLPNTAAFPANGHRVGVDADGKPVPAIGANHKIQVPRREDIQPLALAATVGKKMFGPFIARYRYSLITPVWERFLKQISQRAGQHAVYVDELLSALDSGKALPSASDLYHTELLAALVAAYYERVAQLDEPLSTDPMVRVLTANLTGTRKRFSPEPVYQISSSWRPPEHIETMSNETDSNHMLGIAMDIQPIGAGAAARNPLALLCLHFAAQELHEQHKLREPALLERSAALYVVGAYQAGLSDNVVREIGPATNPQYVVTSSDGTQDAVPTPLQQTQLRRNLATDFHARMKQLLSSEPPLPWPDPPPTYFELYLFALSHASHVHCSLQPDFIAELS